MTEENGKYAEKDLFSCEFVHHKSHDDTRQSSALNFKTEDFSKTCVLIYQTTRYHVTESVYVSS